MTVVIGIDPSLTATGIADGSGETSIAGGGADKGDDRLRIIYEAVAAVCVRDRPVLAVIEDLPKHAQAAGITGMSQGAVRLALIAHGVSYVTVVPSSLKKYATGRGGADKSDMRMELYKRAGIDDRNDNRVDAWWLRAMGLDALGAPALALPRTHRTALLAVWPDLNLETT